MPGGSVLFSQPMTRVIGLLLACGLAATVAAGVVQEPPQLLPLSGNISPVHDPVIIKEGDTYFVCCTGGRNGNGVIPIRTSKDLQTWQQAGFVFPDRLPEWTATEIPRATNAWAPDIAFFNG